MTHLVVRHFHIACATLRVMLFAVRGGCARRKGRNQVSAPRERNNMTGTLALLSTSEVIAVSR